jgi:hypothetical protein
MSGERPHARRALAAKRPGLRILFIGEPHRQRHPALRHCDPVMAFLQKPFRPETVAHKARDVPDGSRAAGVPGPLMAPSPSGVST